MPFYFGPNTSDHYAESDEVFLTKSLVECFRINDRELSVFVLSSSDPYIEDSETINFINSDKIDLVVHPLFIHPWAFDYLEQHFLKMQIRKPWIQITWNKNLQGPNYSHFDYWACNLSDSVYSWGFTEYNNKNYHTKKYMLSSLNNIAKAHRVVMLYFLHLNELIDQSLISMSDDYDYMNNVKISRQSLGEYIKTLTDLYDEHKFQQFYKKLPIVCPQEIHVRIPFWVHDAYIDSYVNIATEHDFINDFVSEKSIKPFLTEQLSVFVAGAGTVQKLRNMGIDVFDDIIDHSYDNEHDPKIRLLMLNQLIAQLVNFDWPKIYMNTEQRRKNNRNFLLSNQLLATAKKNLKNKINNLVRS